MSDSRPIPTWLLRRPIVGLVAVLCALVIFGPPSRAAEPPAILQPAMGLIAMVNGSLRGIDRFGAGIVLARRHDQLLIATAEHLVRSGDENMRDITIRLQALQEARLPATLLEAHRPDLDLALLAVQLPPAVAGRIEFDFHALAEDNADLTSLDAYPVGQVDSHPWNTPSRPSRGFQLDNDMMRFQSSFTGPGSSGGGLIADGGILLGMVLNKKPPHGEARGIHVILDAIRGLDQPIDLAPAYGYSIAGEWRVNGLFQKVILERDSNSITGTIESSDPKYFGVIGTPTTRRTPQGFVTDTTMFWGLYADIDGVLLGNRLDARITGSWVKVSQRFGGSAGVDQQTTEVPFEARLGGIILANEIHLDYTFETGSVGGVTRDRATATRQIESGQVGDTARGQTSATPKVEPETQGWQSILKETLDSQGE